MTAADRVVSWAKAYPAVVVVLLTGVVGGVLTAAGQPVAARWVISALALAIAVSLARGMVADLRAGTYGIDLLAVVAIVSTVVVGEYWAALVVCLMLTGGEALEDAARNRAKRELSALLENVPRHALRVLADGTTQRIDVDEVAIGDELRVRPSELVPVDGVLVADGATAGAPVGATVGAPAVATVDESSLTGESMPVDKVAGDALLSGSVNGPTALTLRATAAAADSQYQRIVELVREAQESKAPFVRLADRVAVPFTILALALAGLAWWISGDPVRFAEVLVVATPCPLIIAAPVAFMAGMGRSARVGVIVKDSASLERMARLRAAGFDKTGTLTRGMPAVLAVHAAPGHTTNEVERLAAGVEAMSTHPLAAAIVAHARARGLAVPAAESATEGVAAGMAGDIEGRHVRVGKLDFVLDGPALAGPARQVADLALESGHTSVHVAVDGRYAGFLELGDEIRPEARATLAELRRLGVGEILMLTGDAEPTARAVAAHLGIDEVHAGLLPGDKVAAVRGVANRPVLMVGDGVNDAPVLAVADVGLAMGAKGSAAATQSADVVILHDDLARVARAVHVGRRTMTIAWQAIALGLGLSVVLMLIAATGVMPAVVGALMQEFVDLACILWALLAARPGRDERGLDQRLRAPDEAKIQDRARA